MAAEAIETRCAIAGGGPAGVMLGFLLARAGIDVVVLEKHADFFRDFRGDTIHPSTLELMHELGLLDEFLALPHQEAHRLDATVGGVRFAVDFSGLPTVAKYIAMMPQWDFLDFLARHGARYPGFRLLMDTAATGLIEEGGKVTGLRATGPAGPLEIRADLMVGADGRHSDIRAAAGMAVEDLGAPMDVLWLRLPRLPGDSGELGLAAGANRILVMIDRGDYWQCAYLIPKGGYDRLKAEGFPAFLEVLGDIVPFEKARVAALSGWDDIKLLSVRVDRLTTWWRPGLLFIGDAAHAMSPIGGVGVNLAVQDAVAAANILAAPLFRGAVGDADLARVQRRRMFPTRATQRLQLTIQDNVIGPLLSSDGPFRPPMLIRLVQNIPLLQRLAGRAIGLGFRREHIETPDIGAAPARG